MKKSNRIFLFAGYDKDGIIDDALVHYVKQLSKFGDIVLCMDCNCKKSELDKVRKYCLHVMAARHTEYDFGSYKRAYLWAHDNGILNNYDTMYLVNDSVFGPLYDISKTLERLDSVPTDAAGIIVAKHKTHSYMESWFVRLNRKIFLSNWFQEFISSVAKQPTKNQVTIRYEHGLSDLIKENECTFGGIYTVWGRYTYNHPVVLFAHGCPFIKRASFIRHNGAAGNQIKYILNHSDPMVKRAIIKTANRVYGENYMKRLLTYNPLKIMWRNIRYAAGKIFRGHK